MQGRSGHRSLQAILSSSSANEATEGLPVRTGRPSRNEHASSVAHPSHSPEGTFGDGKNKRDRKGKRRQSYPGPWGSLQTRTSSPTRTQKHVLLVGDLGDESAMIWKGCECQSDCWNRWLPKGVPLSRKEHDM